jgi:hypothetical protein
MKFKKIILSLLIVTAVGATGFAATRALLSDQASLTANSFSTGTADLQIGTDVIPYNDNVTGFSGQIGPGETKSYFFFLKNNNSGFDMSLAAQAGNVVTGNGVTPGAVTLKFTPVLDGSNTPDSEPASGPITLQDLTSVAPFTVGTELSSNETQRYRLDVSMNSGLTQNGGTVSFDLSFTGTQVVTPTP